MPSEHLELAMSRSERPRSTSNVEGTRGNSNANSGIDVETLIACVSGVTGPALSELDSSENRECDDSARVELVASGEGGNTRRDELSSRTATVESVKEMGEGKGRMATTFGSPQPGN